jgi:hypothetical protein
MSFEETAAVCDGAILALLAETYRGGDTGSL